MANSQAKSEINIALDTISHLIPFFVKSAAAASVLSAAVIPSAYAQITQPRPDIQIRFGDVFQRPTLLGAEVKRGRFDLVITNFSKDLHY